MASIVNTAGNSDQPLDSTVWTIGHSTRSIEEFLGLLSQYQIGTVADIRRLPGSRKYPQYDQDVLAATLMQHGIAYQWLPLLGGRRHAAADSPNTAWRNASFRGYADYMSTAPFAQGLEQLIKLASQSRTALMCAEAVWWRCHRSMVSDALCVRGIHVVHIMDGKQGVTHPMTSPARVEHGQLSYIPL